MSNASSPLLDGQESGHALNQRPFAVSKKISQQRSRTDWTWISLSSIVFNLAILLGLMYGTIVCIKTIGASLMPTDQYCLHSVSTSYNYLTFVGEGFGTYYGPTCLNPLRTISTYASGKTFCTKKEIEAGFEKIRLDCEQNEFEFLDWRSLVADITDHEIAGMRVVEFEEVPSMINLTQPVRLSRPFFERVGNTLMTWEYEMNWHHESGFALHAFWGLVLAVAAFHHVLKTTNASAGLLEIKSSKTLRAAYSIWVWIKINLIIPPAFASHHQRLLFWCTIPTRMETVVVTTFYLFTTYLSVSHHRLISDNIYWDDRSDQLWRYVADRTGIMSYATLPLIWIFAGRNNVFMRVTGLSYQTFNIYHRHIARAGIILAIVHSVVYTYLFISFEGFGVFEQEFTQLWLVLGVVATITMSLLLLLSVSWLRVKFYEIFLALHVILSVITLVGCFLHTSILNGRYDAYLWPLVSIWVLDRGLRLLRLIVCNCQVKFSKNVLQRTHAVACYSNESDVIRVDVSTSSFLAQPVAGQFYYLYQPTTWQGYENHPFTLGAWSSGASMPDIGDDPLLPRSNTYDDFEETVEDVNVVPRHQSRKGITLTFWVRPYDGWTKRLRDECMHSPTHTITPKILLEGPYGHHRPIATFDSVLFIAGGTGIASAVPYILEHAQLSKAKRTNTTHIHLLWTVRQASFISEVFSRELGIVSGRDDFTADLYYTQHSAVQKPDEGESRTQSFESVVPDIQFGRPDITAAISKAATRAETKGETVAVLVCGPPAMADEARVAVHAALKRGCFGIEYFEESFGW